MFLIQQPLVQEQVRFEQPFTLKISYEKITRNVKKSSSTCIPKWFQAGIPTKKGEMELMSRKNKS